MVQIILYWIHFFLVVITVLSVIRSRKSPPASIAWILAITALPVVGLLAYVLAGIDRKRRKLVPRIPEEALSDYFRRSLEKQDENFEAMAKSKDSHLHRSARSALLLARTAAAPVTENNRVSAYFAGKDKFEALLADIAAARESIHMEYYLWRSDALGNRLREALEAKAREGVKIRLIFDGWGSFGQVSYAYRHRLKAMGIEYAYFLDLANPIARLKINYRNHRKITVIDGRVGYTGGMNVGEEYVTGGSRFSHWRDTHLRIEGPAVAMLQTVFLADWHNSGGEQLQNDHPFPSASIAPEGEGVSMQIAISGPDSPYNGIRLHFLELLSSARDEVLIQTPYYIPGDAVEHAMIAASLRGVRVVLMTVGIPDRRIPFWAAHTYYIPLLEAGVEIHCYQSGFLHSKVFIQDRKIASVGTCNIDLRSFNLAYEVNAVLYSAREAAIQAERFNEDLRLCSCLTMDDMRKIHPLLRLRNNTFRLLSPLI